MALLFKVASFSWEVGSNEGNAALSQMLAGWWVGGVHFASKNLENSMQEACEAADPHPTSISQTVTTQRGSRVLSGHT